MKDGGMGSKVVQNQEQKYHYGREDDVDEDVMDEDLVVVEDDQLEEVSLQEQKKKQQQCEEQGEAERYER